MALPNKEMKCRNCGSENIVKNGHRGSKQNYRCQNCGRQFIDSYTAKGYPEEVKRHCLTLHDKGIGFRAIERSTGVNHNTVINWVKQAAEQLPDAPAKDDLPQVTQ